MDIIRSVNVSEFDFIFIDGWHSINQVLADWEYTNILGPEGIVGLHDTAYHPGPKYFLEGLDADKWDIVKNAVDNAKDWGIGFVRKK
jgi:predicted O-methyltransferase YrrM